MSQPQRPLRSDATAHPHAVDIAASRTRRSRWRRSLGGPVWHIVLAAVALAFLLPFYWMLISALKDNNQIFARPLQWWPSPMRWDNFSKALTYPGFPFLQCLLNSLFYASSVAVGTVLSSAAVAYGFARLRFPGRDLLFGITVSTMLIPGIVLFIPTFVLVKHLGLLGTYVPLVAPAFLGNAFFIFLLRQFFLGIPGELADAARIDGAGEFRIYWQVMLPLARTPLMVVGALSFLWTWHEFFGPLIYLAERSQYPLALGLYAFQAQHTTEWALLMAAATLTTLPLIVVLSGTQRYIRAGITFTGMNR